MVMNFVIPIGIFLLAIFVLPIFGVGILFGYLIGGFILAVMFGRFLDMKFIAPVLGILLGVLILSVGADLLGFGQLLTFFQSNAKLTVALTGVAAGTAASPFLPL